MIADAALIASAAESYAAVRTWPWQTGLRRRLAEAYAKGVSDALALAAMPGPVQVMGTFDPGENQ